MVDKSLSNCVHSLTSIRTYVVLRFAVLKSESIQENKRQKSSQLEGNNITNSRIVDLRRIVCEAVVLSNRDYVCRRRRNAEGSSEGREDGNELHFLTRVIESLELLKNT